MLVAATVSTYGVDGLIVATMVSELFLVALGYLCLGTCIKFIPYPVTVGFTAGIVVIIFASQLSELFGLTLSAKEPGELVPKLIALGLAAGTINIAALGVATLTIILIVGFKRQAYLAWVNRGFRRGCRDHFALPADRPVAALEIEPTRTIVSPSGSPAPAALSPKPKTTLSPLRTTQMTIPGIFL